MTDPDQPASHWDQPPITEVGDSSPPGPYGPPSHQPPSYGPPSYGPPSYGPPSY
ncbi:MAG: hypothetical protein JWO63_2593, partial [Frankiales bacterium]|nr:hypothetical protein [Frankiales bacterium]